MSDAMTDQRSRALVTARCARGVMQARYWLALERAKTPDPGQRAVALAEAHRVLERSAELRRHVDALEEEIATPTPELAESGAHKRGLRSSGLRAA
jgi:hypothetical protein